MHEASAHSDLSVPRLNTSVVGTRTLVFEKIDSTNERALLVGGDGTVVVADRQSAGRGRHGRPWHSAPGLGLWFSVSFKGDEDGIAFMAPLAIREALRPLCNVTLKWPNDVLVDGRKICGVLVERRLGHTVLGIGLNVGHRPEDFPDDLRDKAASLRTVLGYAPGRAELLHDILSELDKLVIISRSGGLERIWRDWSEACAIRGKRVRHCDFEGIVTDIDRHGGLTVAAADGEHRIVFGEIVQLEKA